MRSTTLKCIILGCCLLSAGLAKAQAQTQAQKGGIVYRPAMEFRVGGQAFAASAEHPFRRLPECLKGVVRDPVWELGCNSAGIYVRFRSDAEAIYARWTNNGNHMPHMTDCGTGGLDLYALIDNKWTYVGSGFNWEAPSTEHSARLVGNMEPQMREYMLYLALYDEVKTLELDGHSTAHCTADTLRHISTQST